MDTTQETAALAAQACRPVTPDEVEHLHELGWVKLRGFVDPDVVARMLVLAQEVMGTDGDSNPLPPMLEQAVADGAKGLSYFNAQRSGGMSNPMVRALIGEIGENATALQRRPAPGGGLQDVRYYSDFFVPKLPSAKATRHGGNGTTAFHQDFITFAVDRSGGMTFWLPLEAYGAEAGTMSFVNGSHRIGVLGDYTTYGDGDALDAFPQLRDLEMTEPMVYEPGDLTVHTHLTIHGAGPNVMDRPRWAWFLVTQPADVCWNGAPCPNFNSSGMRQWEPFGDERFPVISA